ncbi:serine/threonine-protein kinase [Oxynema aestuarii]|uniref:non-specific serine/threonine protein kinase n=1 Tax=Oxynema aestuarii AP17 TaxID=2064643 RepID=A0A6H1TWZ2_9CYAN|nr:serine/threonine-protein kinase [Oxynema aestuarii]QIZ71122.1 protein kinase [Oxynema aestuarii AP17]
MAWKRGYIIQNKYIIDKLLETGGFGVTYLVRDKKARPFAMKTLKDTLKKRRDFAKFEQEFLGEADLLASFTHPHIVRVYELIEQEGTWCMVMEYIDGIDLASAIEREGALPEADALRYIGQIGDALNRLHDRGFLHRDLKPFNILLRQDRRDAVLIDFGLARAFVRDRVEEHPVYGSRGFAPIEQYDQRALRGAYTDVYGLAATLYSLVTAQVPESATARDRAIAKGRPDPLVPPQQLNPKLSDRANRAILAGIALNPCSRPAAIAQWLQLFETDEGSETFSPTPMGWNSAVGLDYSHLQDLLASRRWEEADRETAHLFLLVCGREKEGKINSLDLKNFPCRDLRIIDRLWVEASQGKFGFSVQNKLWRSLDKDYDAFGDRVGWRQGQSWLPSGQLQFAIDAPEGHLPTWGRRGRFWPFLASRVQKCVF